MVGLLLLNRFLALSLYIVQEQVSGDQGGSNSFGWHSVFV